MGCSRNSVLCVLEEARSTIHNDLNMSMPENDKDVNYKYVVTAIPNVSGASRTFDVPVFCKNHRGQGDTNITLSVKSFVPHGIPRPGDDLAYENDVGRTRLPSKPVWVQKRLCEMALACGAFGGGTKGAMELMNRHKGPGGSNYTTMWKEILTDARFDKWAMWLRHNRSPGIKDALFDLANRADVKLSALDAKVVEEKYEGAVESLHDTIRSKPYEFARLLGGKKAVGILREVGVDKDTLENVGTFEAFDACMRNNGHVCIPVKDLSKLALVDTVQHLRSQGLLVQHNKCLYTQETLSWDYTAAKNIAKSPPSNLSKSVFGSEDIDLSRVTSDLNVDQMRAMRSLIGGKRAYDVVVARAGCGKTFFVATLVRLFKQIGGVEVVYCAPTHRATRRIMELLDEECKGVLRCMTAQKLVTLARNKRTLPFVSTTAPILLVIDEVSMVDAEMFVALTDLARKFGLHVLLVGDDMQLPSIGCGDVLRQLLTLTSLGECPSIKVERLSINMRVSKSSRSSALGRAIEDMMDLEKHDVPRSFLTAKSDEYTENGENGDFLWIPTRSDDHACAVLCKTFQEERDRHDIKQIMCIACRHVDVDMAQTCLREQFLSSNNDHANKDVFGFAVGDRVVTSMIDEDVNIYNALRGTVTSVRSSFRDINIHVTFDNGAKHTFNRDDVHMLKHGYCCTTHVAQGSECATVIVFLPATYGSRMHTRTMLYTAMTRAWARCILVASEQAVIQCMHQDLPVRHSNLGDMIRRFSQ